MICETLRCGLMLAESITELNFSEGLSNYKNDMSRDVLEEVVIGLGGAISQ